VVETLNAQASAEHPHFVPQAELAAGTPYEAHIAATRRVPTRENLHDFFNGLIWLKHPELKWRLNTLQDSALRRKDGGAGRRGPLRDALTLFDEYGACWQEPDPVLLLAWRRRDWVALFVTHRQRWIDQRFEIVGHALLEQLAMSPRKGLTAHVLAGLDPLALDEASWAAKPFGPLPVLGIPGWWTGQERPDFYADPKVFRGTRALKPGTKP
jgi:Protein of unknown function (DUF3025)